MKQMYKLLVMVFAFTCSTTLAQQTITGTVISAADQQSVIGATVVVEGTANGTVTDADGKFLLTVDSTAKNLVFSYVGMRKQTVPINSTTTVLNITMEADNTTFDEVVVTALAVKREKRELGFGTTTIKSEDLNKGSQSSALNSLQGKVAGAQITNATGAPGGSTRVVLRGGSSFTGDNNALIVVDGVPVSNNNYGVGDDLNGKSDVLNNQYDVGNRGNDINPQDIENVTVLKGAAATALYGQQGANGVIMITTKKGALVQTDKPGKKFMVSFSTQTGFSRPLKLPERQTEYGQGGLKAFDLRENFNWGPKLDGTLHPWGQEVEGEARVKPYSALPNSLNKFFATGKTYNNNLAISGANKGTNYYLSYNNFKYDGIVPGTGYMRNSLRTNISHDFGDKLSSLVTFNYNRTDGDLVSQGQGDQAPLYNLLQIPIDIPIAELKDLDNKFNTPAGYFGAYALNPYWVLANNKTSNIVDRFNTNITLNYKPLKWLTFTGRFGSDNYTDSRFQKWRKITYTNWDTEKTLVGKYSEDIYRVGQYNADLIVQGMHTFKEKYMISVLVGGNMNVNNTKNTYAQTAGLAVDDLYTFENSQDRPTLNNIVYRKNLASIYYDVNFGYKNFLFLGTSGRNDWTSTLAKGKNNYFYAGANVSLVLSELIKADPMALSYWKIRASFAQVGKDAEPYSLRNVFVTGTIGDGYNESEIHSPWVSADGSNVTGYTVSGTLRNENLKPEISTTFEAGTEISFLKDRLGIDFTYYWKRTKDQIITIPVAPSSGFTSRVVNAGLLQNQGVELSVRTTPVNEKGVKWEVYGTFTKNYSKVIKVADDAKQLVIGGLSSMAIVIQEGQPYGSFYSITSERDPDGNPVVDEATGVPIMTSSAKIVGNFQPKWLGSIGTSLSYKGLRFTCLFDARVGGVYYSSTRDLQKFVGSDPVTLYNDREDFVIPNSVYIGGDGQYYANTTAVSYQDYWTNFISQDYADNLVTATNVKLREISLAYSLPKKLMEKTKYIANIELSLFGNNVWMWTPKSNTYGDPEVGAYGSGNAQGFEFYNLPSVRTLGFGVKVDFQ
ncbi:MAG TPA: SusC/RagA family TonB-linked outer membrane protein [Chitinophagales bacterium]|nr:SusC/RagA family TonB-linked outer membrane protein [Chitinophagales bacterium]